LVLDTDVVVAGMRSDRGASRQLLLAALNRQIVVLLSVPLMLEYEAVLSRREHLSEIGLEIEEMGAVLDAFASVAVPVALRFLWRPQLKDPRDEMVLETAVNGRADWLVTFNERHFGAAAPTFGIGVTAPGALWRKIRGEKDAKE
jgi:putative PIN family toxin of toxin-antitoxin system